MRMHKTVADVMTEKVITVGQRCSFKDIVALLTDYKISAVPVVDNAGSPLGVVSETDLLYKVEHRAPSPAGWLAKRRHTGRARAAGRVAEDVMSSPAIGIEPEATVPVAAKRMHEHDIDRLVVIDDDGLIIGIVTRSDLLRVYIVPDEELVARVRRDVVQFALWQYPLSVEIEVRDGIVTLQGELERRSLVPVAVQLTRATDGVVDVVNKLTWATDDTQVGLRGMRPPLQHHGQNSESY